MNDGARTQLPKILVVDDSRMVRATIVKHVKGRFAVREEVDGEDGWQALLVDPEIKIVLSDIEMPRLDGYGFLDRIRASKIARMHNLPVIILSGDEDEAARQKAFLGGANDFVIKGIDSDDLLERLEYLLDSDPNSVLPVLQEVGELPEDTMPPAEQADEVVAETQELVAEEPASVAEPETTASSSAEPVPEAETASAQEAGPAQEQAAPAAEPEANETAQAAPSEAASTQGSEGAHGRGAEHDLTALKSFHPEISVMVIEVDEYGSLIGKYGKQIGMLVSNHLLSILLSRVRNEDTVSLLAPSRFVVLSQSAEIMDSYAFALRLWNSLSNLAMNYRQDKIRVKVTIGVANSITDGLDSISDLINVALARVRTGAKAGGDRVMGDGGPVTQEMVSRHVRQSISIDKALSRVRAGADAEVREYLSEVVSILVPLLELADSQLSLGLPIDRLKEVKLKGK